MYKINHGKVLGNTRHVDHIAMAYVKDYAVAAMMRNNDVFFNEIILLYNYSSFLIQEAPYSTPLKHSLHLVPHQAQTLNPM